MKHSYQAAPFASQPEPQYNLLGNTNRHLTDGRIGNGASPMLSQTYSQRSVGNGAGLQQRGNPSGRSHQLSMPTMSQFGGMSETQPQVHSSRPLSSGYMPGASQPAMSGVFRPGSAPQRPTSSQLDVPTASQWTQPAVTSSLGGQGYGNNTGSLLQQLPASNQPMLRPKQVALLRTSAAAPQFQGRPGSAPGLLSGGTASPAHTPKQPFHQPPSLLQSSQHQYSSSQQHQQQQQYLHNSGSQGALGPGPSLLGSQQQQLQDLPIIPPSQQQGYSGGMTLDDGSAGTGVTVTAEPAAGLPAVPAAAQQKQPTAALDRLGPRMRGLLQALPPLRQHNEQTPSVNNTAAKNPTPAGCSTAGAAQPSMDITNEPVAAGHAGSGGTAAAAGTPVPPAVPLTAAAVPALDPEQVLKRLGCLEDYCSSMNTIVQRDIPLLLQQQDSSAKRIAALDDSSSSSHAALEARMEKLTSAVASFMDGLRVWQQKQQQHVQQLQEQAAKQQTQPVLFHSACQTSPGLMGDTQSPAAAADSAAPAGHFAPASLTAPGTATVPAAARDVAALPNILSPTGDRYKRLAASLGHPATQVQLQNQFRSLGQEQRVAADAISPSWAQGEHQQDRNPAAAAAAAAEHLRVAGVDSRTAAIRAPQAAEAKALQGVETTDDEAEDEQNYVPAAPKQQRKQTRQQKRKSAKKAARKPAAKPRARGRKGQATAKAAAAEGEAETAAAMTASKLQPAVAPPAVPAGGSGRQVNSSLVQSKLSFQRVTRSVAAKLPAAAEAPTAAAAAELELAAPEQMSPAVGTSTDLTDSMDGVAAVAAGPSNPGSDEAAAAQPAWFMPSSSAGCAHDSRGQAQQRMANPLKSKQQQYQQPDGLLGAATAAAASETGAAAASGAGRQFRRRSTPPPARGVTAAAELGSGRVLGGARPVLDRAHNHCCYTPAAPAAHVVATIDLADTMQQTAHTAANLPPTQNKRGTPAVSAAAGAPAASRGHSRTAAGSGAHRANPAGSGVNRQATGRVPLAARSGVGAPAAVAAAPPPPPAARPTASGAGGFFARTTLSSQQHLQHRPQAQLSGGTSRLLGMKRSNPETPTAAAAPSRSSVMMLFGEMDSDSMDCVFGEEGQQQVVTGPGCRGTNVGAQQWAAAGAVSNGLKVGLSSNRSTGPPRTDSRAVDAEAGAVMPACGVDDGDIARQVAARMAQHRSKQRRLQANSVE